MSVESKVRAVTTLRLKEMKDRGEKIAMLTSYDYSMAKIVDAAGVDVILVGDSAANVMAGYETTVPITLDAMIYHARSVVRAVERALVVVDLPFGTYQGNSKMALDSAIRIMKETEADAVKLEGGEEILESVERILTAGIPIMGHLGLTPQSIHKFGTYTVRAREEAEAEKLVRDARLLEEAGCFAVVLEKIPAVLAERVSKELSIPTIGIGAGGGTDGQVLVIHDMLGINKGFSPRFLLCCRTAPGRPFCRCLLIFLRHIRFRRNTMLIIIPLVKRAYFPHSQGGPIPNGILCRPGDFFFRIIAGRIRPLRLPVRRLFRFAPDKVSLHLLLSGIHHRLILPLPCLDFRQWPRLRSGLTGKPPFTGAGGHKLVELGIFRKTVDERNQGTAVFDKAGTGFHIGDVVHLLVGNIQEFAQLFPVRCRLIQHDNEFGVGKHGAGLNRIQQIFHILGNCCGKSVALSELPPCRVEEGGGKLIFKNHMEFVNEYMGSFSFLPVQGHTVQHSVCNDQQAGGLQLRPQAVNVKHHHPLVQVHIALLSENIQRAGGVQLQGQCDLLGFWFRLLQQGVPQSAEGGNRSCIGCIPVNHRNAPVNNGLVLRTHPFLVDLLDQG